MHSSEKGELAAALLSTAAKNKKGIIVLPWLINKKRSQYFKESEHGSPPLRKVFRYSLKSGLCSHNQVGGNE